MSISRRDVAHANGFADGAGELKRFHRIHSVRLREQTALRTISCRTNIPVRTLRSQEDETNDISLSTLYLWQNALDVPAIELLLDPPEGLCVSTSKRLHLLRAAKTAKTLSTRCPHKPSRHLARYLLRQLSEIMPELQDVEIWPKYNTGELPDGHGPGR